MKINRINIGQEVRQKVAENGMSKAKFAELLGVARQNVEKTVFQKHSLDTDLLCNICEVLNHNFFDSYKSDDLCNDLDYAHRKEIKATISVEVGAEKQERVLQFIFEGGSTKILNE